jgi:aspartyl protease family protein
MGGAPASVGGGGGGGASGREILIAAGPGGHFMTSGQINGKAVQFMVDTGATSVAMGQREAERIGVDWKQGQRGLSQTAGGVVPVYVVSLTSIRIGDVEVFGVNATIVPVEMPFVLLGNSFLSRFSMRRDADVMKLEKK